MIRRRLHRRRSLRVRASCISGGAVVESYSCDGTAIVRACQTLLHYDTAAAVEILLRTDDVRYNRYGKIINVSSVHLCLLFDEKDVTIGGSRTCNVLNRMNETIRSPTGYIGTLYSNTRRRYTVPTA